MKNYVLLLAALVLGTAGTIAATTDDKVALRNAYDYNNAFIFVENGITFSVYPDGEFDFYIDDRVQYGAGINTRNVSITFNSGFNYDPYVQYDDYGAVIQVENVPVYYDYYGRVDQIGDVNISYRNGRLYRLGGMHVFYDNRGFYDYHTGYINVFNRYYVYSPYHVYFARPAVGFCLVYNRPYRRYYQPIRYSFYAPYRLNARKVYAKAGSHYAYNPGRRQQVYRNDKRVVVRDNRTRRSEGLRTNASVASRNSTAVRTGDVTSGDKTRSTARSNATGTAKTGRSSAKPNERTPQRTSAAGRSADRTSKSRPAVSERSVPANKGGGKSVNRSAARSGSSGTPVKTNSARREAPAASSARKAPKAAVRGRSNTRSSSTRVQ